ncbi:DUF3310 domain-containing protein [Desulfovibrio sp.]|uniref:DUF3310 domain-containing protein n=1 Tax=Desulfovibrio sp. TaxID=885 RepID=UPI003078096C
MGTSCNVLICCEHCAYAGRRGNEEPCKRCSHCSAFVLDISVLNAALAETKATPASAPAAKPAHYSGMVVDVIDFCLRNGIPYPEGNVIKYVCRWRKKGGIADLEKARDYLDRLIAHEKSKGAAHV